MILDMSWPWHFEGYQRQGSRVVLEFSRGKFTRAVSMTLSQWETIAAAARAYEAEQLRLAGKALTAVNGGPK